MNRGVMIYAGLLVVALVGAYASWTHEAEEPRVRDGVVVVDIGEKDLTEVRYSARDFRVSLTRRTDGLGEYVWVESTREEPVNKKPVNPHAPDDGHGPDEVDGPMHTVKMAFKAGTGADPVFGMLAPFVALRAVTASAEAMEDFGLKEPQGKLEIVARGKTHAFDVGAEGYGHRNTYVRDVGTGKVYLVDGAALRPLLRGDERLPERRLMESEMVDLDRVEVTSAGKTVVFEQRNKADAQNAFWAVPGSDEANLSARTWIEKFARMRSIGNPESMGDAAEVLRLKAVSGKTVSEIVLYRSQKADGTQTWFGKSDFTRGLVELPMALASNLADDFLNLQSTTP